MRSAPIQWYALAVCFATLMCLIVALGIAIYDIVEIAEPELTNGQLAVYATNERFAFSYPDKKQLSPADLESARLLERAVYVDSIRHAAGQSLIFAGIILAIDAVVFGLHWWIADGFARRSHVHASPSPRFPLPVGEG